MSDRETTNEIFDLGKILERGSVEDLETLLLGQTDRSPRPAAGPVEGLSPTVDPNRAEAAGGPSSSIAAPEADEAAPAILPLATEGIYGPLDKLISRIDREVARRSLEASISTQSGRPIRKTPKDRALVFDLGGALFAVPTETVTELGALPDVTPIPGSPAWISGVANLRGSIYGVIDLRPFVSDRQEAGGAPQMVVLRADSDELEAILIVDRVVGKAPTGAAPMNLTSAHLDSSFGAAVIGGVQHGDRVAARLDVATLLRSCESSWGSEPHIAVGGEW